ncbi:hypothetical protein FRB91_007861 [Serendipita sp. 411]|nr:hypothetical protein FRC18_000858 [Serendipita sp. 400]KAG8859461.1 hypothetical protein FRB91_007861 [Serendipita sp. 411]
MLEEQRETQMGSSGSCPSLHQTPRVSECGPIQPATGARGLRPRLADGMEPPLSSISKVGGCLDAIWTCWVSIIGAFPALGKQVARFFWPISTFLPQPRLARDQVTRACRTLRLLSRNHPTIDQLEYSLYTAMFHGPFGSPKSH